MKAGLIILFDLLLWPRKRLRAWRIGRAQAWLRAHIWLGLLSVPLVFLHSGGHLGAPLSVTLVVFFTVVIASGLWGLALQQYLPRLMFDRVPAETIYSEIEQISAQNCYDAEDVMLAVCGPAKDRDYARLRPDVEESEGGYLTVGGYRAVGKTRGKVLQARAPTVAVPNSEPLRIAFYTLIGPYLKSGGRRQVTLLGDPLRSAQLFHELKARLDPAAHSAVDEIEDLCSQRRQFDLQTQLHHWLHGWLLVHAPLSVMLFVLLIVHIYVACKYW
ncbi:MAG: hypothetical protein HY288_18075 [Planctomycetia bacterium]|nr:hypothetical protein [Planctomycetia bacterium]